MGKPEIARKLKTLCENFLPFTEECQVVYLLVEIRKMLDRDNNRDYPLLRFYCDWCVHTEKDRITIEMESIMNEIYAGIYDQITNKSYHAEKTKIVGFAYMEDLQGEMNAFLALYNLSDTYLTDGDNWISFVSLLVRVLADQPINNPCATIQRFSFIPTAPGCVEGEVIFTNKIGSYDYYTFGNAY